MTYLTSVAKYEIGLWLVKIGPFPDHFFMSIRTKSGLFLELNPDFSTEHVISGSLPVNVQSWILTLPLTSTADLLIWQKKITNKMLITKAKILLDLQILSM